jgi:hypothetical protein
MLVVPSLEKSNKLEILLFTNVLGRQAHKNSELNKIQRRSPLFTKFKKSWRSLLDALMALKFVEYGLE